MKSSTVLLLITACASGATAPTTPTETPVAAAPNKPRTDRPPVVLGGAPTWGNAGIVAGMRWCPGDKEIVAIDEDGWLRRYRSDGTALAAVSLGKHERAHALIDCRADGTAVAIAADGKAVLVDAGGKITRTDVTATEVAFAPDGSVLALDTDHVQRWRDGKSELAFAIDGHGFGAELTSGGGFVEDSVTLDNPKTDGTYVTANGKRIKLPGRVDSLEQASVSPDGAVAAKGMMNAFAWMVSDGVASKQPITLIETPGYGIIEVAATPSAFVAMDNGGRVEVLARPLMRRRHLEQPCGESNFAHAMAASTSGTQLAIACENTGIRVVDLAGKVVSKDGPSSAADTLAWSPSGDRLATRDSRGIRVWQGDKLVATVAEDTASGDVWWASATAVGGPHQQDVSAWTLDGKETTTRSGHDAGHAARSAHGEVIVASRSYNGDVVVLVIDGKVVPVTLPESKHDWIAGATIADDGKRALVWRGDHPNEPASEVLDIDVGKHTATTLELVTTAVAAGTGAWFAAAPDGTVRKFPGGSVVGTVGGPVTALAVHGDVVVAGGVDGAITLIGAITGKLAGHAGPIRALAIAPDGLHLASTSSDATRTWDLTP